MTAINAGALNDTWADYHEIPWEKCYQNIKRLQARIVKAVEAGRWGKVKSLQRIITRSFSAKAIAVRRVTENRGKKTPGVDGELWLTPTTKVKAIFELNSKGYKPLPVKRIFILKKDGSKRPLGIPTMKDRAMQALYLLALEPIAETLSDPHSYGFRPKRSTADAIERCFKILARGYSPQWILEGDIKACFDNLSHPWLINNIPVEKRLLEKWLKSGLMEQGIFHPSQSGAPQGGILSPTLANMALDGMEKMIKGNALLTRKGAKVNVARYADDFIVTASSKKLLEQTVKPLISQFLKERGLTLSENKTKITHINDGFDFLGQNVRKYNNKLLIKPSKSSCQCFLKKVKETLKGNKTATQFNVIRMLNPLIRGWAYYHRHVVSKDVFLKLDYIINFKLWQWAKRRHPNKNARWIERKYFSPVTQWGNFTVKYNDKKGKERVSKLVRAGQIKIVRHCLIKDGANPFDPEWKLYFEKKLAKRINERLRFKPEWQTIWKQQEGKCPHCGELIDKISAWDIHHIKPEAKEKESTKVEGKKMMLHQQCHQAVMAAAGSSNIHRWTY